MQNKKGGYKMLKKLSTLPFNGTAEQAERLAAFMRGEKQTVEMSSKFAAFKKYLMSV